MRILVAILVVLVQALSSCIADIKVSDYIYWKKEDMTAFHLYFPSRALVEEQMTNGMAVSAVKAIADGLQDSLSRVVQFQVQELQAATMVMEGAGAQGCVKGISQYMTTALEEEISNYNDCTADALPKLQRLNNILTKGKSKYQSVYQKAIVDIDNCEKIYPNKDSISRLKACVEVVDNNYFKVANSSSTKRYESPAMTLFTETVVVCAENAAKAVVKKGQEFLKLLVHCAKLSENIDSQTYEAKVSHGFSSYLTSKKLACQIRKAQKVNSYLVKKIEQEMLESYELQKRALEQYVIESRGLEYYSSQLYQYLQNYFSIVLSISTDYPGSVECTNKATTGLKVLVNTGAAAALKCDQRIVNDTKLLLAKVNDDFLKINTMLPSIGNAAILSCFTKGYIFADRTIIKCFDVLFRSFTDNATEIRSSITKDVAVLLEYERIFFSNTSLPCGDSVLRKADSGAVKVMYDLERCHYINSGNKYEVTTSMSMTTSVIPYKTVTTPVNTADTTTTPLPMPTTDLPSKFI